MPLYNPASTVTDATISTSDITTNNVTTAKHGFAPKGDAVSTHFLAGDLSWGTPAGTGAVASDPIWDAAGDLAVGTGADTAAKLAKGAAGGSLSIVNAAVAWNSGTSMPGSKATGDRYWRTDLGREAYWDGTQWLTTTLYHLPIPSIAGSDVFSATDGARFRAAVWNGVYDLYLVDFYGMSYVASGSTGSALWTVSLYKETKAAAYATSSVASFSTGTTPDTNAQFTAHTVSINALMATTNGTLLVGAAKTSTPGNLTLAVGVTYRLVLT